MPGLEGPDGACTVAAAAFALLWTVPSVRAESPGVGSRYAVASENETVTRAALGVLRSGGNAVDAAVTAALTAGVASSSSSGLGGGGFAIAWIAKEKKAICLDFRETAPRVLDAEAFEHRPLPATQRGKLVGVPGELAGLSELHRRFGKKKWAEVVDPAARVASNGYEVSVHLANMIQAIASQIAVDPPLAALLLPGGRPVASAVKIKNPTLASTLSRIEATGSRALYEGAIPAELSANDSALGGALAPQDFADYKSVERTPIEVHWEGYDVFTMPPPSAGGLMLAETLGMFTRDDLRKLGANSAAYEHVLAESMRGAVADRAEFIGDPSFSPVDLGKLLSPARLAQRRKSISVDRTHAIPRFFLQEHGTHHIVTADADGNVVSLTTTVNRPFGAWITGPKSGVALNDELDDFTSLSTTKTSGLDVTPNAPRANARPASSMTPTIVVKDGAVVLALGGSGGTAIAPNVTLALLGRLVFDETPLQAVSNARFVVPTEGSTIALEAGASPDLRSDLERRGEIVSIQRFSIQAVQMIAIEQGKKLAASDPRKHGSALAE